MPEDATDGVAKHSFLGCNHQSTRMASYNFYVQLLWYPMYYPRLMKAWVSPVQWCKPYSILALLKIRTWAGGFKIISGDHFTDHFTTTANLQSLNFFKCHDFYCFNFLMSCFIFMFYVFLCLFKISLSYFYLPGWFNFVYFSANCIFFLFLLDAYFISVYVNC